MIDQSAQEKRKTTVRVRSHCAVRQVSLDKLRQLSRGRKFNSACDNHFLPNYILLGYFYRVPTQKWYMNFSSNKTNSMSEVRAPKARGNFWTCLLYFFSILCAACEIFRVQCLCQIKNQDNFKISGKSLILQDKTLISRQFQDRGNPVLGRFER